jgi:hypothetical protein
VSTIGGDPLAEAMACPFAGTIPYYFVIFKKISLKNRSLSGYSDHRRPNTSVILQFFQCSIRADDRRGGPVFPCLCISGSRGVRGFIGSVSFLKETSLCWQSDGESLAVGSVRSH